MGKLVALAAIHSWWAKTAQDFYREAPMARHLEAGDVEERLEVKAASFTAFAQPLQRQGLATGQIPAAEKKSLSQYFWSCFWVNSGSKIIG